MDEVVMPPISVRHSKHRYKARDLASPHTVDHTTPFVTSSVFTQPKCMINGVLRSHQISGLSFLLRAIETVGGAILADEMGLGKTIQAIALIANLYEAKSNEKKMRFIRDRSFRLQMERQAREEASEETEEDEGELEMEEIPELEEKSEEENSEEENSDEDDDDDGLESLKWLPLWWIEKEDPIHEFFNKGDDKFLVVVPKSTLPNWDLEFKKWVPSVETFVFWGESVERSLMVRSQSSPMKNGCFDVCITTYDVVMREMAAFNRFNWRIAIFDEGHKLKNKNAQITQKCKAISADARVLLTGTPLQNDMYELWSILNVLNPSIFDNEATFIRWFCRPKHLASDVLDGYRATIAAGKQIRCRLKPIYELNEDVVHKLHVVLQMVMLRRVKSEVENIPPKVETKIIAPLTVLQLRIYQQIIVNGLAQKARNDLFEPGTNTQYASTDLQNTIMELRKCVNHPYLFKGVEPQPFIEGEHLVEASGKMRLLDMLLARLKQRGSKVLLFSQFTMMLDVLQDYCIMRGHSFCRLDGSTRYEDRAKGIARFNNDESVFLYLLSTRAGGLGINLTKADVVILYDSDWNAQVDLQAIDRCHRIGQRKPVSVFRLMTMSVEQRIVERAEAKLRLDALVMEQARVAELNQNLSKDQLLSLISYGSDRIFSAVGSFDSVGGIEDLEVGENDKDLVFFSDDAKLDDTFVSQILDENTQGITTALQTEAKTLADEAEVTEDLLKMSMIQTAEDGDMTSALESRIHTLVEDEDENKRAEKRRLRLERQRELLNKKKREAKNVKFAKPTKPKTLFYHLVSSEHAQLMQKKYEHEKTVYDWSMANFELLNDLAPLESKQELSDAEAEKLVDLKRKHAVARRGLQQQLNEQGEFTAMEETRLTELATDGYTDFRRKDYNAFINVLREHIDSSVELIVQELNNELDELDDIQCKNYYTRFMQLATDGIDPYAREIQKVHQYIKRQYAADMKKKLRATCITEHISRLGTHKADAEFRTLMPITVGNPIARMSLCGMAAAGSENATSDIMEFVRDSKTALCDFYMQSVEEPEIKEELKSHIKKMQAKYEKENPIPARPDPQKGGLSKKKQRT
ncbi:hypothetical protein PCE1_003804 [Barthelona sp. PCE]